MATILIHGWGVQEVIREGNWGDGRRDQCKMARMMIAFGLEVRAMMENLG